MKKSKKTNVSIKPEKEKIIEINHQKVLQMFKDLDKSLKTDKYVFRKDLQTYERQNAVGFRIKGRDARFGLENIFSKLDIRCVTFIKRSYGPEQEAEIHIDPKFEEFFFNICIETHHVYVDGNIKPEIQVYEFLYQHIR